MTSSGPVALLFLSVFCVLGQGSSLTTLMGRYEFSEPHMGTVFRIVLYAPDPSAAETAAREAFGRIRQLNGIMSDYQADSELMRLCRQAGGPPVTVSHDLYTVLTHSQELARKSEGAFDVTIGPLVRLWRRTRRQKELPGSDRLAMAKALVGYENMLLNEKNGRNVQLLKPGMALDLGGIAKGYAADEAQAVLRKHGIRSALVAAGGDVVVSDAPPASEGWSIEIAPFKMNTKFHHGPLILSNAAVSTSGDAEQYVEIGGKRYSHIVDPSTGVGIVGQSSVTVVAPKGIFSDSLATAGSILGAQKGSRLIDSMPDTAALFVTVDEDQLRIHYTQRWKRP